MTKAGSDCGRLGVQANRVNLWERQGMAKVGESEIGGSSREVSLS